MDFVLSRLFYINQNLLLMDFKYDIKGKFCRLYNTDWVYVEDPEYAETNEDYYENIDKTGDDWKDENPPGLGESENATGGGEAECGALQAVVLVLVLVVAALLCLVWGLVSRTAGRHPGTGARPASLTRPLSGSAQQPGLRKRVSAGSANLAFQLDDVDERS